MSDLIAQPKPAPKIEVLPKHDTCGTCAFAEMVPQDLNMLVCFGGPPTPAIMGMQQTPLGPQPAIAVIRPQLPRSERACGVWKRKSALVV